MYVYLRIFIPSRGKPEEKIKGAILY